MTERVDSFLRLTRDFGRVRPDPRLLPIPLWSVPWSLSESARCSLENHRASLRLRDIGFEVCQGIPFPSIPAIGRDREEKRARSRGFLAQTLLQGSHEGSGGGCALQRS